MASNREYRFTLTDMLGRQIRAAGGFCFVSVADFRHKATLFDANDAPLTNPIALNSGMIYFRTAKAVPTVDCYIYTPSGHFILQRGVIAGSIGEIAYDGFDMQSVWCIPWSKVDLTANTETDTGIDLPLDCIVSPHVAVDVTTLEASKTFQAGTLSTESGGDADGFIVAAPLDNAQMVAAKSAATATRGALIGGGTLDRGYSQSLNAAARSISILVSAAATVAAGVLMLPLTLSPKRFVSAP